MLTESELEVAKRVKGFMPDDEGLALHEAGLVGGLVGPLLEIGSYCGKSAVYLGQLRAIAGLCSLQSTTIEAQRRIRRGGSTTIQTSSIRRQVAWTRFRTFVERLSLQD